MKKLIVLCALFVSQFSFAQTLPTEQGAEVIRAVQESLAVKDLACIDLVRNEKYKASGLNWGVFEKAEVTITENNQPVITIYKMLTSKREIVAKITTDETFTVVTKIKIETADLSIQSRNVGTIIRPRYEDTTVRTLAENIDCK